MAYCTNCGKEVNPGAKFCSECGAPITAANTQRATTYEGEIHKCPNCGEVVSSFVTRCPACGMEFRDVRVTGSVQEFADKLEMIEVGRKHEKKLGFFARTQRISETDEQKINLIKNFPIPNAKEDILEFMILATTNANVPYKAFDTQPTKGEKALLEAWNIKVKQAYAKAKTVYGADPDFARIQELYASCQKARRKNVLKMAALIVWPFLLLILVCLLLTISSPISDAKENDRLEKIVVEVQDALDKQEYKLALNNADSIDYQRFDTELERKWDIQREYWVDKVLEEASKSGVNLEYIPTKDIDKTRSHTSSSDVLENGKD